MNEYYVVNKIYPLWAKDSSGINSVTSEFLLKHETKYKMDENAICFWLRTICDAQFVSSQRVYEPSNIRFYMTYDTILSQGMTFLLSNMRMHECAYGTFTKNKQNAKWRSAYLWNLLNRMIPIAHPNRRSNVNNNNSTDVSNREDERERKKKRERERYEEGHIVVYISDKSVTENAE